jgi:hypothetical protein
VLLVPRTHTLLHCLPESLQGRLSRRHVGGRAAQLSDESGELVRGDADETLKARLTLRVVEGRQEVGQLSGVAEQGSEALDHQGVADAVVARSAAPIVVSSTAVMSWAAVMSRAAGVSPGPLAHLVLRPSLVRVCFRGSVQDRQHQQAARQRCAAEPCAEQHSRSFLLCA